jgi:hypothetical protein
MPKTNHKKECRVATSPLKKKNAMHSLLESMDELAVAASKRMTTDEVRKVRKEINDLVDRAVVRKPRRIQLVDKLHVFRFGVKPPFYQFLDSLHVTAEFCCLFRVTVSAARIAARFRPLGHRLT